MPVIPVFRLVPLLHLLLSRIFTVGEKRGHFVVTKEATMKHTFATILAIIAVFIASYVPARRAAELPPVVTLRGSSV